MLNGMGDVLPYVDAHALDFSLDVGTQLDTQAIATQHLAVLDL